MLEETSILLEIILTALQIIQMLWMKKEAKEIKRNTEMTKEVKRELYHINSGIIPQ